MNPIKRRPPPPLNPCLARELARDELRELKAHLVVLARNGERETIQAEVLRDAIDNLSELEP